MSNSALAIVDLDAALVPNLDRNLERPAVVIGYSTKAGGKNLDGIDVALTTQDRLGRSWVQVEDLEKAVTKIQTAFARNPMATLVAAQVMRTNEGLDADKALMVESFAYGMLQNGHEHTEWLSSTRRERHVVFDHSPDVTLDRVNNELTITFNRPQQRNAYRARTRAEFIAGLELALLDDSISSVHLRGEGPSFCSGGDLGEFGTVPDGAAGHLNRCSSNATELLSRMGDRTIAHVHGPCYGAGVELSAACATVVADSDATFTLPEVAMGLIPGAGGTWSVPHRIGRRRATWLAITGESIDVKCGLDWGLIDKVHHIEV